MLNRKHATLLRHPANGVSDAHARLAPGAARLTVDKRQMLFRAQEPAPSIYEVVDGALMIYRLLADGRRQIVDLALPGSLCGFSRGASHECSCESLAASTVIAYDRAALKNSDTLGTRLAQKMEQQICELAEHIVLLGRRTTEERLATFLVQCAQTWRARGDDKKTGGEETAIVFHIPMTRVEIGDYLGMSLETVSRGIADLERRGLIKTGARQGEMRVHDLAALSAAWRAQRGRRRKRSTEG